MSGKAPSMRAASRLVRAMIEEPRLRVRKTANGGFMLAGSNTARQRRIEPTTVADLLARGLLEADGGTGLRTAAVAKAWLIRAKAEEMAFKAQHNEFEYVAPPGGGGGSAVLVNRGESPVSQLARRCDKAGNKLLQPFHIAAAERLRADFERGQLQPSVTANWSATISFGRRSGGGGLADLTGAALAARRRVEGAVIGVGPEFSGVLIDACCFLKGLETIEHERQWPARSAKLVLQLALAALARHYGLSETAAGARRSKSIRRWGADGYRPDIG